MSSAIQEKSSLADYVQWLNERVVRYDRRASRAYFRHGAARIIAAVGAIAAPILFNSNATGSTGAMINDWAHVIAGFLSFSAAAALAVDGVLHWGDQYRVTMLAYVALQTELFAYRSEADGYRGKTQAERDDMLFRRTRDVYETERHQRVNLLLGDPNQGPGPSEKA